MTAATAPPTVEHSHSEGQRCYECEPYRPLGGATSFAEYDAFREAEEAAQELRETTYVFEGIVRNILNDDDLSIAERSIRLRQAADDLQGRLESEDERGILNRIKGLFLEPTDPLAAVIGVGATDPHTGSLAFKEMADGRLRWVGVFTNIKADRMDEDFLPEAHRDFEAWCDQTKQYPPLVLWHELAADLGTTDGIAYDDLGLMHATGLIHEHMEPIAHAMRETPIDWGMSHGYRYRKSDLVDGHYRRYRSFELSALPMNAAANPITGWSAGAGGSIMPMTKAKRELFERLGGADFVTAIESRAQAMAKDLDGTKDAEVLAAFKDVFDADPSATVSSPAADGQVGAGDATPQAAPAPTAEKATPEVATMLAALVEQTKGVPEMASTVAALDERLKALEASEDERMANAWGKAVTPLVIGQRAASENPGTILDGRSGEVQAAKKDQGDPAQEQPNWYENSMRTVFAGAAPPVAAGQPQGQ